MMRPRPAAAIAIFALMACSAAIFARSQPDIAGENGLWLSVTDDSVVVHWLTAIPAAGSLAVATPTDTARFSTPAGQAHRAVLSPAPAGPVTLQYGSADALHTTFVDLTPVPRRAAILAAVDSLYIVGDTHGDMAALTTGLTAAGLIDEGLAWTGGRRHLVFAGDLTDRGPDVLRLLWFVYRLEREAAEAGGAVHVLLGNHEIMVMLSDLRYVHPKEAQVAELHGASYQQLFDVRESFLGRWLASKPAVVRTGDVLITHGGVTTETARLPLQAFDDTLAQYMGEDLFHRWADTTFHPALDSASYQVREDFFWGPRSVFWHREYVQSDTLATELDQVLTEWGASILVVGHTAVPQIEARYDGRLIAAHTRRYGAELLLLARAPAGWERYRITADGPPERF
ncbi:MAG TPA: metallophosphoesterase [Longimicrobiales bacterium]|nr:metallophosphoesterase [Longimicrobiales bacterium]